MTAPATALAANFNASAAPATGNADIITFLMGRGQSPDAWLDNQADGFKADEPSPGADDQADGFKSPSPKPFGKQR